MDGYYTVLLLLFGLALSSGVWWAWKMLSEVPVEDRSYLDRPPLGFRLTWPLISLFAYYTVGLLSDGYQHTTQMRLQRAGRDYMVSPAQFFAAKLVSACLGASFAATALGMMQEPAWIYTFVAGVVGFYYPEIWLKETTSNREHHVFRALPFYLDIITLAVESGTNLTNGINQAVQKAPDGPLREELSRFLREVRAGKARSDALRDMADRVNSSSLTAVASGMIQAEKTGASLGPVLRAQADQLRSTRFLKAEKLAMEAPVKLLGPLIMFIFPTTFLVLGFVILSKALAEGVITWEPLVWAFNHPGPVF